MTNTQAVAEIRRMLGGAVFGCKFRKKDGSIRTGSFRLNVKKDVKGVGLGYDADAYGNLVVWDMNRNRRATICLDRVIEMTVNGKTIIGPEVE